jgi:hypothetical protein
MENRAEENTNKITETDNTRAVLSVFGQGSHFASLYKKTEKLIAAIYMITDFIKDNEPLKWRIRENALELLSINMNFTTVSLSERRELLKKYQALSLEIVSLSGIAQIGGLISEMNHSVLSREFEKLAIAITRDENKKSNEETIVLDPNFFEKTDVLYNQPAVISKGHVQKTEYVAKPYKSTDVKEDRKSTITRLLLKKSGLNIKDFSQAIKGCSEKTIQRELLAMVAAGVLKKEGERRWSTYSLAK